MNIVHIDFTGPYTDDTSYQENILPWYNVLDGYKTTIIVTMQRWENGIIKNIPLYEPIDYVLQNGVKVIRMPFKRVFNRYVNQKIRAVNGLYELLEELKPDVIMFHGIQTWELITVARYKREHPEVKLYVDSHSDFNNSARGFVSKHILHRMFYKRIVNMALPQIDKLFYVSVECGDFMRELYKIPKEVMEFYPLGGIIFSEEERQAKRQEIRKSLRLTDNNILFVHSGKMDKKKRTYDILKAFLQVKSDKIRLVLVGSMTEDVKEEVEPLIETDPRISFVGWKTADELLKYLCAADVYVQPGGQSATMQNAICCGCAVMLYPHKSHEPYLQGNGYYIKSIEDMKRVFKEIADNPSKLKTMSSNSMKIARELLDYKKLAARLYV
ncbi:glycosyltransferase family 4 protein [Desulfotruncus alcoholivorax]|uniref:glycosyltransferase family 4 protein n=1 Tax=Desulfotruncus alcoholivorax TaxID=265477 RepID=UPI0004041D49|nr:glycosyltransferase [Desulfotruncus alcoholivorax]